MNAPRIVHFSTVHARTDVRIFQKEAISLASAGYDTYLLVGDGKGDEERDGVHIRDIGAMPAGRLRRMLVQSLRMWRQAVRLRAALYHFHDPELIPVGLLLRCQGAAVVYDSHEDVPRDILSKEWIAPRLRRAVAAGFEFFEDLAARALSAVVAATPHIAQRFARTNRRSVAINNYPLPRELDAPVDRRAEPRTVCYVGGIGMIRGAREMIEALAPADARLILAGPFESPQTEAQLRALEGWSRVDYRGVVSRAEVREIMARSHAGLLFFHPEPNHVDAQPNKMFEYMSAGLPVLASDFPLWRSVLVVEGTGLCADPTDAGAIAAALRAALADPEAATTMGERGRRLVRERYRWDHEERKLLDLYRELT
jgi:glycosyltransferase involved in cell wall biosynthesis